MNNMTLIIAVSVAFFYSNFAQGAKTSPKTSAKTATKAPSSDLMIKNCQKKKPPVSFSHQLHTKKEKIECKTCHHPEGNPSACSAAKCHAGQAEGKRSGCAEMGLLKNPFHITCIKCHKEKGEGPTTCNQCHKK